MESDHSSRKTKLPKIEEMTKEQIRKTIIKKRESIEHAQRVVEILLEPGVSAEQLLRSLPVLNRDHVDDIVEERAITLVCGYPPCAQHLSKNDIPKQQFRISLRTNKVYDITMRKNFCSNWCYKATLYIKKQMLTSPLWFREHEVIPTFQLMPPDVKSSMGQEVDLSIIEKINVETRKAYFASINEFASASLSEIEGTERTDGKEMVFSPAETVDQVLVNRVSKENLVLTSKSKTDDILETIEESLETHDKVPQSQAASNKNIFNIPNTIHQRQDTADKYQHKNSKNLFTNTALNTTCKKTKNAFSIMGEIIEHPEKKIDPIISSVESRTRNKQKNTLNTEVLPKNNGVKLSSVIIHVEKCVAEWFTLDSMILLLGGEKVKEMVAGKGECIKEYLNNMANGLSYSSTSYDQYQQLCKKLNMLELEDHRNDSKIIKRETKPLPDYSIIKEEGKRMDLKVRAFLSGKVDVPELGNTQKEEPQHEDTCNLTQLALVDRNAQNALRRKILLTNLRKVLHDLQQAISIQGLSIESDVRLLVNSFKLKANNIMFKPVQWTLIGIIVIKLLSLRNVRLQQALKSPMANHNLQLLLLSYKQDGGYLDRLLLWLTDVDRLLDTTHTQLTFLKHSCK